MSGKLYVAAWRSAGGSGSGTGAGTSGLSGHAPAAPSGAGHEPRAVLDDAIAPPVARRERWFSMSSRSRTTGSVTANPARRCASWRIHATSIACCGRLPGSGASGARSASSSHGGRPGRSMAGTGSCRTRSSSDALLSVTSAGFSCGARPAMSAYTVDASE